MTELFTRTSFDGFNVSEVTIKSKATFVIDGRRNTQIYSEEELNSSDFPKDPFVRYSEIRSLCFDMIKGRRTPSYIKIVFILPSKYIEKLVEDSDSALSPSDISTLGMTVSYKNGSLNVLTGTALNIFTTDKSIEHAWDHWAAAFLDRINVSYETS